MISSRPSAPRWFVVVIIVVMLPVARLPFLLDTCSAAVSARTMLWIYPVYVLTAGYLAWQCYRPRRVLAWILLGLLVLSHIAVWMLGKMPSEVI